MSRRYEVYRAAGCDLVLLECVGAMDWDEDWCEADESAGEFAVVLGNPWASALVLLGTLGELEDFGWEVIAAVVAERAADSP